MRLQGVRSLQNVRLLFLLQNCKKACEAFVFAALGTRKTEPTGLFVIVNQFTIVLHLFF